MSVPRPRSFELTFAFRLIQALHGNTNNLYLILAIIAWVRRESGMNYIGNNPLNLRPGADDLKYRSGVRRSAGNGYFSTYANLTDAARASANRLLSVGSWAGYRPVVAAIRRSAKGTKAMQEQALDFLYAIALSKWSATHYGYGRHPDPNMSPTELFTKNKLVPIFQGLTRYRVRIPAQAPIQPPKPPPVPKQPRSLAHTVPRRGYLQPLAAFTFYAERHEDQAIVPAPIIDPGW
jgi:hypothetical protein